MSNLSKLIGIMSGGENNNISEKLLFNKVIGFKGMVPGTGTSTIVQNVAIALSKKTTLNICVLDMSMQYPTQYSYLMKDGNKTTSQKDILDYSGDISEVTSPTKYKNIYLIDFRERTIADMFSSRDSDVILAEMIDTCKTSFDVILVDLSSYELTNMNTRAAIKCNKIISVADQSIKCLSNLKKSLNTQATLAIPFLKANKVVLNKVSEEVLAFTQKAFKDVEMTILGQIYFSEEILKAGINGNKIWEENPREDFKNFSDVINNIIDEILDITPKNNQLLIDKDKLDEKEINEAEIKESFEKIKSHGKNKDNEDLNTFEDKIIEI
ncbi:AAA family ATPase [Clostridioides difficile]